MVQTFGTAALIASGIVAGVFFAIAVSVMPVLMTLPNGIYMPIHRELGKGYHPIMPIIVVLSLAGSLGVAVFADDTAPRVLSVLSIVGCIGIQVVSQFGNVPINKRVQNVDENALPADWADPRPGWRDYHYARTACAFVAFGCSAVALALL